MTISKENLHKNFWKKIVKQGDSKCWLWLGVKDGKGYGQIKWSGRRTGAHRMAYKLSGGNVPDDLVVAHRCDNPSCCNPKHLFVTTQAGNLADMRKKRRGYNLPPMIGEAHAMCKLTDKQCLIIKKLYKKGTSQTELAKKFGVWQSHVSRILRGENRAS